MTVPAQREVAVKKAVWFSRQTLAAVLSFALPAFAQDAPLAERLSDGSLKFNPTGAQVLENELKRLQGVERLHKGESWIPVVAISSGVGVVVGVIVTLAVVGAANAAQAAKPPSP